MTFGSVELAFAYDELSHPQFTHGKELIALLGIGRGDRVLDIGCGTGRLAAFAVEHVGAQAHIVGIDPAPPRIEVAQQRRDPRLEFRIGQAQDLSQFADATFDVAYMNSVLNWIDDRPKALGEAYRVLKPRGRFGIGTTVRDRPNQLRLLEGRAWKAARGAGDSPTVEESPGWSNERGSRYAATAIDFLQATTYGELAAGNRAAYYAGFRDAMEALLAGEYADRVSSDGILLERYILLAVADKR
jgi:SAM-dependent methyltransferase